MGKTKERLCVTLCMREREREILVIRYIGVTCAGGGGKILMRFLVSVACTWNMIAGAHIQMG